MSFWKLAAKTLSVAPTDGINGILAPLKRLDKEPADEGDSLSQDEVAAHHKALDALLCEPDLLSEIKGGSNQRLTDFLARKEVVLRLGGWVVWGLGRGFSAEAGDSQGSKDDKDAKLESGLVPDEMEAGKIPDEVLQAAGGLRTGMGGVPHPDESETTGGPTEDMEEPAASEARKRANFPRLCTEILVSAAPSLSDTLFRHEAACTKPHTCPHPADFLLPFWESVLGSTEMQLAARAQQIGFWARVNGALLDGPVSGEVLEQILQIPHLPARLLALLPTCSPLNDVLLLLLRVSRSPSPLIPTVVVQAIRMLDPFSALGRPGHTAAEDLLRGIIEICIAVPRTQAGPPGPGGANILNGGAGQDEAVFEWRDTTLARHIADEKSVRALLDWTLAESEVSSATQIRPSAESTASAEGEQDTPKAPASGFEAPAEQDDRPTPTELRTSSLLSSLAVLIDLIRKNNSDFVEQQMLAWARRKQAANDERQMLEEEGAEPIAGAQTVGGDTESDEKGPSVVDLGVMLSAVAHRLPEFQRLLQQPRTPTAPRPTAGGVLPPLTLERFRICEFYAELLHCSNMSLLNRPPTYDSLHDATGHLARGWQAADELAAALAATQPSDDATPPPPNPASPDLPPIPNTLPGGASLDSSADSVPAGSGSEKAGRRESSVSTSVDERELPPTPSVYSEHSRYLPLPPPAPGPLLKTRFIQHRVIPSMIELFFNFPWNNFLHSVVFDVLQQIFQGRLDRTLDRQLAESVFIDGRLCERILEGQRQNDEAAAKRPNMRLGYMGHLCLIAEAAVKLFERYPDLAAAVASSVPQPAWDEYVSTTLQQARERDLTPLSNAGGLNLSTNKPPSASSLSDEDDEFPMNSARTGRATDAVVNGLATSPKESAGANADQFSRYLADELASDRTVGSSDEDDDDDGWFSGPRRMSAGDGDFNFETPDRATQQFGFDDRFDEAGPSAFRSNGFDSDEDTEWAPFEAGASSASEVTNATSNGFIADASEFGAFESSFAPTGTAGADDFGDFEAAAAGTSSIVLPSMDQFEDFDLGEESRPTKSSSGFGGAIPVSAGRGQAAADADGSDRFGRLSLGDSPAPNSPAVLHEAPDAEVAAEKDLGPAMHPGAHLTEDGHVEAQIDGKTIRVPADDIIVTNRRNSLGSRSRSNSVESAPAPL